MTPKAPTEVQFTVPLEPPTVNHYVKHTRSGRHYVTKEAQAFLESVYIFSRGVGALKAKAYHVMFTVFQGKGSKGDVDNYSKCVLDGLVKAGVIHSDAAVTNLWISKRRDWENPRTEIIVRAQV